MEARVAEPKDFKILVPGSSLARSYRNILNSYFDTHQDYDQSFYWEILVSSIQFGLSQYCRLTTNTNMKERANELTDKLSSLSYSTDAERVSAALLQIVQLWETEEFQNDFNSIWDPETLHAKYWLKTYVPLARELLNSKRDIANEDLVESSLRVTGVIEDNHTYGKSRVTTTLLGGRRAERRKWLHAFENVSALLMFISAETFLVEQSTGHIDDRESTLHMIREISGSRSMANVPLFLFISRIDLIDEMIKSVPDVKKYLPSDYNGDVNARAIVFHFIDKFCEARPKDKPLLVICGDLVDRQVGQLIVPFIFQSLILSDNTTKRFGDVMVDTERNLVVYYPNVRQHSTVRDDVLKAMQSSDASDVCSFLKESDDVSEKCKLLLNNTLHADLKLTIGDTTLPAHSLILRARVPELLTLWTENGTSTEITVTDLDVPTAHQFLEYIYTGTIEALELTVVKEVLPLLNFADKYALQPFMLYLCKVVADKIAISKRAKNEPVDVQLVQELLHFGEVANSDYLRLKCTECMLFLEEDNTPKKVPPEKKPKKRAGCSIS